MKHLCVVTLALALLAAPASASSIAGGGGGGGGGNGTVTTTGTPANGKLAKFSGATSITNGDLSGDCTTAGTLAITCTKTNGAAFGTAATASTGTSGATLPLNNGANSESGPWTFNAGLVFGNQTAAFGTTGTGVQGAWTHTDNTTAAGTVALGIEHVWGAVTDTTPTNAIAITNEVGSYFQDPVAGTHLAFGQKWALSADDLLICPTVSQSSCSGKIGFGNDTNGTFVVASTNGFEFHSAYNNHYFLFMRDQTFEHNSVTPLLWGSSSSDPTVAADTGISRDAAGVIDVGTGGQGSKAGAVNLTTVGLQGVTVASLPISPIAGMIAYITDGNAACSVGATPTGSGSNKCFVGYNGSVWKEFGI